VPIEHANGNFYPGEKVEIKWPVQEVRFDPRSYFLVVDVDEPGLVDKVIEPSTLAELGKYGFRPKKGLHMTVLSYHNAEEMSKTLQAQPSPEQTQETLRAVESMAHELDWAWRPTGHLHSFQGRKERELKIITHVDCPDFAVFHEGIRELMPSADFKFYPPHITLLKKRGEMEPHTPASIGGLAMHRPHLSLTHLAPEP